VKSKEEKQKMRERSCERKDRKSLIRASKFSKPMKNPK
jgi:hypothetical protein